MAQRPSDIPTNSKLPIPEGLQDVARRRRGENERVYPSSMIEGESTTQQRHSLQVNGYIETSQNNTLPIAQFVDLMRSVYAPAKLDIRAGITFALRTVAKEGNIIYQQFREATCQLHYAGITLTYSNVLKHIDYSNQSSGWFDNTFYCVSISAIADSKFTLALNLADQGLYVSKEPKTRVALHLCRIFSLMHRGRYLDASMATTDLENEMDTIISNNNGELPKYLSFYGRLLQLIHKQFIHLQPATTTLTESQTELMAQMHTAMAEKNYAAARTHCNNIAPEKLSLLQQRTFYSDKAILVMQEAIESMRITLLANSTAISKEKASFMQDAILMNDATLFKYEITKTLEHAIEVSYTWTSVQLAFCRNIIDSLKERRELQLLSCVIKQLRSVFALLIPRNNAFENRLVAVFIDHQYEQAIKEYQESIKAPVGCSTAQTTAATQTQDHSSSSSCSIAEQTQASDQKKSNGKAPASQTSLRKLQAQNSKKHRKEARQTELTQKLKEKQEKIELEKKKAEEVQPQEQARQTESEKQLQEKQKPEKGIEKPQQAITQEKAIVVITDPPELLQARKQVASCQTLLDKIKTNHLTLQQVLAPLQQNYAELQKKKEALQKLVNTHTKEESLAQQAILTYQSVELEYTKKLKKGQHAQQAFTDSKEKTQRLSHTVTTLKSTIDALRQQIRRNKIIESFHRTLPLADLQYLYRLHQAVTQQGHRLFLDKDLIAKLSILFFYPDDPNAQAIPVTTIHVTIYLATTTVSTNLLDFLTHKLTFQQNNNGQSHEHILSFYATAPSSQKQIHLSVKSMNHVSRNPVPLTEGLAEFNNPNYPAHYSLGFKTSWPELKPFTLAIKENPHFFNACKGSSYTVELPSSKYINLYHYSYCAQLIDAIQRYGTCKSIANMPNVLDEWLALNQSLFATYGLSDKNPAFLEIQTLNTDMMIQLPAAKPFLQPFFFTLLQHLITTQNEQCSLIATCWWSLHLTNCLHQYAIQDAEQEHASDDTPSSGMKDKEYTSIISPYYELFQQQLILIAQLALDYWNDSTNFYPALTMHLKTFAILNRAKNQSLLLINQQANNSSTATSAELDHARSATTPPTAPQQPISLFFTPQQQGQQRPPAHSQSIPLTTTNGSSAATTTAALTS